LKTSKYLVADAYFSKITFVKPFLEAGFQVISRLRDDADLQYIFLGEQKKEKAETGNMRGKLILKTLI
jgi:hypothetical protein